MRLLKFVAALGIASAVSVSAQAQQLGIGTMGQGTSGYSMGAAIARVLSSSGVNAIVQPSAGTSAFLPLVQSGELDMGIANVIELAQAVQGEGSFKGHKLDKLRAVARLFPFRVGVFVRADSDIKTIADLKGKRVTYGFTSQVTLKRVLDALLATGGVSGKDIVPVMVPNVVRGADEFAQGTADAAFFAMGSGKVSQVDAAVGGLRFLPIPDGAAAEAAMQKIVPQTYVAVVKPAPNLAGVKQPMRVMSYDYMLAAGAQVPDAAIAKVVRALHDHKADLASSFASFKRFDPAKMHRPIPGVAYHKGALEAYKAMGQ